MLTVNKGAFPPNYQGQRGTLLADKMIDCLKKKTKTIQTAPKVQNMEAKNDQIEKINAHSYQYS